MPKIHSLACVDPNAQLASDVEIGPFCVVGPHVSIDSGCRLYNNVTILGHTTIGKNNIFYPNAVIGTPPQDLKYRGGPTRVQIGDNNQIREAVTIQCGTETGSGVTIVGSNNLLMVNCHIGHDAHFGDKCIIGNNVMIAGHVRCHDGVAMMGGVGIHHFVTVGEYAYIAGYARIHHDVPPYVKVDGADRVRALNALGLKRHGFSDEDIEQLERATRRLFFGREKPFSTVLAEFNTMNGLNPRVKRLIDFIHQRNQGKHGRYQEALRSR